MKIFLLSFSILFVSTSWACVFSGPETKVFSLAGPVTMSLKHLDLLKDPKLKGVSVFHPVDKENFKGEFLPGGIFLSQQSIQKFFGSLIFYDESRELSKLFSRYPQIKAIEIKSRNLSPLEVVKLVEKHLSSHVKNCDLKKVEAALKDKLSQLKKMIPEKKDMLFFLGEIKPPRLPELLMVNDGVVKWLSDEKLIRTYPSELAYVNWSARILESFSKKALKIGMTDSGSRMELKMKRHGEIINLTYPGFLIPGFGQVDGLIYLFQNL